MAFSGLLLWGRAMFRFLGVVVVIAFVFVAQMSNPAAAACSSTNTITSIPQLKKIGSSATALAGDYCLGKTISANGATIAPIGTSTAPFTGTFDGQGYEIGGLTISGTGIYVGLFAYLGDGGKISNVGLTNVSVMAPSGYDVGGLVGRNRGTITNSYTTGPVSGTAGNNVSGLNGVAVGGLVGWNFGTITQSYSTASITSPTSTEVDLGGLAGGNDGSIFLSYAAGWVSGTAGAGNGRTTAFGGLVGWNDSTGTITQSYATGIVSAQGFEPAAGGLIGVSRGGTVYQSYASGSVYGGTPSYAGGLVGYMDTSGIISNSFAAGVVTAGPGSFAGGLVGQLINSVVNWAYATGAADAGDSGQAAGLVSWGFGSRINQSYATGWVTGSPGSSGGLVGDSGTSAPTVTSSYWDVESTGQSTSPGGGQVQTIAQLKSGVPPYGLPFGFDQIVWGSGGSNANINNGFPYLLWQGYQPTFPPFDVADATLPLNTSSYTFAPMGQLDPSKYSVNALALAFNSANSWQELFSSFAADRLNKKDPYNLAGEACLATVYTMIARAVGVTTDNPIARNATIDLFQQQGAANNCSGCGIWSTLANKALTTANNLSRTDYTTLLNALNKVNSVVFLGVSLTPIGTSTNIATLLTKGPVILHGPNVPKLDPTGHWILATQIMVDHGAEYLVANEPLLGSQVRLLMNAHGLPGPIHDIYNPRTQQWIPFISSNANIIQDFATVEPERFTDQFTILLNTFVPIKYAGVTIN
jgi:hypothetical protein